MLVSNVETNDQGSEQKLKRVMGFWDLVFFGVVFMSPTVALAYLGYTQVISNGHSTLVFFVGAVAVFFTCLNYAKFVQVFPSAGSAYTYTTRGLSPKLGFLVGWTMMLDYILTPMFIFILFGLYMNRNFPILPFEAWMLIYAAVVFTVNILGLKLSAKFNMGIMTLTVLIALVFSVLATIYLTANGISLVNPSVVYNASGFSMAAVLAASSLAVLSFLGFDGITTIAEESTCTPKKIGKAIIVAVCIQAFCLIFLAYLGSLIFPNAAEIANPDTIAYDLNVTVGGSQYNFVVNLLSQFMSLATTCAATTAASRLLYAMGRDKVLPQKVFGHLGKKYDVPSYNVTIIVVLCVVGAFFLEWYVIAEIVAFGALFGFICVNISTISFFYIRRKEGKIFQNLILPLIGLAAVSYVMLNTSVLCKTVGLIWLGCGIVYLAVKWFTSKDFVEAINKGLDIE